MPGILITSSTPSQHLLMTLYHPLALPQPLSSPTDVRINSIQPGKLFRA